MIKNRYARIHLLFRILAETKLNNGLRFWKKKDLKKKKRKIYELAEQTKAFWKRFFRIDSLKDLSDEELKDLERILEKRIKFLKKLG